MIPAPQYIVFYNGTDRKKLPETLQFKLSDSFIKSETTNRIYDSKFEWTATIININSGHNQAIMDSCSMLDEYSKFIEAVRKFSCNVELKGAITMAIDECLKEGIKLGREEEHQKTLLALSEVNRLKELLAKNGIEVE